MIDIFDAKDNQTYMINLKFKLYGIGKPSDVSAGSGTPMVEFRIQLLDANSYNARHDTIGSCPCPLLRRHDQKEVFP